MKKLLLCIILTVAMFAISVGAEETVIYENDFSNPSTLSDFKQYRAQWEIKDGGLYLTENLDPGLNVASAFSHIIYQSDEVLTDYVAEVDYMNIQTSGGIVFRSQQSSVDSQDSGFYGYLAFVANDAAKGAFGCSTNTGTYKGNINVGKSGNCNIGSNVHIKVIVKGNDVKIEMTNIDNGKTVYEYTYKIGTSEYDQVWNNGTVGLRMRAAYTSSNAYSAGNAYFDNFKITTADDTATTTTPPTTTTPSTDTGSTTTTTTPNATVTGETIDTSNLVTVYENSFDNAASIADFTQYRGTWEVYQGKLYLTSAVGGQSHIVYGGDMDLVTLTDYVVDVDMYNIQTQGGVIIRSDYANVSGDTDSSIMGYLAFVSNNGNMGALGAGKADGTWLEGNIKVSPVIMSPGMNIHMQVAVKGTLLQLTITDIDTGKQLWTWCGSTSLWSSGSFGFRLRGTTTSAGLSNINNTCFDNLVVSVYGEEETQPTVVKLTIGETVGYVNDVAKTLDAAPIIRESRTMLPVRFVAEAFGAEVKWDGATSTATLTTADTTIEITIGATTAKVNGVEVTLDAPAFIENSRTYLPVRFVAENLGATVAWDGATSTATLTK
ncbi:MAG: copper amine oxidase N-terminal domain-containing protein [Clostridia bacterium]|nr:copper amine oxidase N-terminal domain-containing protein [Clostridia bacterium]